MWLANALLAALLLADALSPHGSGIVHVFAELGYVAILDVVALVFW